MDISSFKWTEFNDECYDFIQEPLATFSLTPGIKKKELLISKDPWTFYS